MEPTRSDDFGEAQFLALGSELPEKESILFLDLPDVPPEGPQGDEDPCPLVRGMEDSLSPDD